MSLKQVLSSQEKEKLMTQLKERFEAHEVRHQGITWSEVEEKLDDEKIVVLYNMEVTEGEPDVTVLDGDTVFTDFSKESPKDRRSVCYDGAALESRKKHKPATSAIDLAHEIGIELLTEGEYRELQSIEPVDLKTSSWILTTEKIRNLKGALFCDRRYDTVFVYHNGADSYYSSRGFRGKLKI